MAENVCRMALVQYRILYANDVFFGRPARRRARSSPASNRVSGVPEVMRDAVADALDLLHQTFDLVEHAVDHPVQPIESPLMPCTGSRCERSPPTIRCVALVTASMRRTASAPAIAAPASPAIPSLPAEQQRMHQHFVKVSRIGGVLCDQKQWPDGIRRIMPRYRARPPSCAAAKLNARSGGALRNRSGDTFSGLPATQLPDGSNSTNGRSDATIRHDVSCCSRSNVARSSVWAKPACSRASQLSAILIR